METAASRFPAGQPDGFEWAALLLNSYGLGERSVRGENLKVASEGISPEVASLATVLFLSWEKEDRVRGHDHASPWAPTPPVEVQYNRSLFQGLDGSLSPPQMPSSTGQRKTSFLTHKMSRLQVSSAGRTGPCYERGGNVQAYTAWQHKDNFCWIWLAEVPR